MSIKKLTKPNLLLIEIGSRIHDLLDGEGKTQKDLAKHVGLSEPSISAIINGKQEVGITKALGIANYFNVSVEWLFRGPGDKQNDEDNKIPREKKNLRRDSEISLVDNFAKCFTDIINTYPYIVEKIDYFKNQKENKDEGNGGNNDPIIKEDK